MESGNNTKCIMSITDISKTCTYFVHKVHEEEKKDKLGFDTI